MIGRDAELAAVHQRLSDAAAGSGAAMLIHGSAGVGKSALLRSLHAAGSARGFQVLATAGMETERWFPFAALNLLLQPVLRQVESLPATHRQALSGAFGATDTEPDVYRVGLAVLDLLADNAARQPVLVLADDLQWIDSSSRDVLGFVARRTHGHALLLAAAARTDDPGRFGAAFTPELHLRPLTGAASARLLEAGAPGLPPSLRSLILDRAAGNPLALVELPKAVRATAAGTEDLPLTQRLETAFADRTDTVSPACRTFLLALAAEPAAPLNLILDVSQQITGAPVSVDALQEAVDAGLVVLSGGNPEFGHPLMRSAIYTRARVADRHAVHRALAEALRDLPDRQLAHQAASTIGTDPELAGRLERFADESLARGKAAAALPALEQAANLVPDGDRRTGLLVRAAELSSQLSDRHRTRALLTRADADVMGPVERARLLLVSDNAAFEPDEPQRRIHEMTMTAAAAADAGARVVAENLLWRAAARCFFQDGDDTTRAEVAAEVERWRPDPDDPLAQAVRAYALPYRDGAGVLARFDSLDGPRLDGRTLHFLGSGAMALGDFTHSARFLPQAAAAWRAQGRLSMLARALAGSWPRYYLGQLDRARAEAAEGLRLALETDEQIVSLGLRATTGLIAVTRGDTALAERMTGELRAHPLFAGMRFVTVMAQQVDGLLALLGDRPAGAYEVLARTFDPDDPHHHSSHRWLLAPDLADAAVAAGTVEPARELMAGLPGLPARLPSEMMLMALAYTDAVLAPDDEAEERYATALTTVPAALQLVRARLHLHHGRWLRRQRRNVHARVPLRAARNEFDRLGARPWAELARAQLRATGESSDQHRPSPSEILSAEELEIVELAAQGLSNREIGERLFMSHRTVGSHLYRIFPRIGVTSRRQLAAVLAPDH
jgi:DNA-binding CsgD family transcriptional regulator